MHAGPLPASWGSSASLGVLGQDLILGYNFLSGEIPDTWGSQGRYVPKYAEAADLICF